MTIKHRLITKKPEAAFVLMTEELVDQLLELNTRNRNQRPSVVAAYQRAFEDGRWVATNQGIGVSASGFLLDGQHRLEALREAGYPLIMMLLVTGLPDEAMAAVDAGANRSAQDYLKFLFDTNVSALVAAVLRTSMSAAEDFVLTKYQPAEYAEAFQEKAKSITAVLKVANVWKLPAAITAALVDAHHKGYESEVIAFTVALTTGEMLARDNPAMLLRNWIAAHKGNGGNTIMKERYWKTTRALRAWVEQQPLTKLYSKKRAPLAEAVPA